MPPAAPRRVLSLINRQRLRQVDMRQLRPIVVALFDEVFPNVPAELGINLVAAPEITRLNETFLQHQGVTDVITFNYAQMEKAPLESPVRTSTAPVAPCPLSLHGEMFICLDEAVAQAHRFRTTWQSELVRYVIHGVLHLLGFDDQQPAARRRMKREEERILRHLARQFDFRKLARM